MNCHPDDNYTLLQGLDLCGSHVCEAGEPGGEKVSHKPIAGPRDLWTDSAPGLIVDRLHAMQGSRKWAHKALSLGESRRNVSIGNAARTRHLSASPRAPLHGARGDAERCLVLAALPIETLRRLSPKDRALCAHFLEPCMACRRSTIRPGALSVQRSLGPAMGLWETFSPPGSPASHT